MIGRTNVGGSGGAGNAIAYIGVIYEIGSTVTCTNGTKTLRAKDTSGLFVFFIPEIGTWTVTATDGTREISESVVISTMWQDVVVDLSYAWDGTLFYNGDQFSGVTGGWAFNSSLSVYGISTRNRVQFGTNIEFTNNPSRAYSCFIETASKIDLTNIKNINATIISYTPHSAGAEAEKVHLAAMDTRSNSAIQNESLLSKLSGTGTVTLNVSSVNSSKYITIGMGQGQYTISKIWCEFL